MNELTDRAVVAVACDAAIEAGDAIKTVLLSPAGTVESAHGAFIVDADGAAEIVAKFEAHGVEVPIDFEHATLNAGAAKAPAAGWITRLFFDPERGLLGLVRWNAAGRDLIRSGAYKYISPVLMIRRDDRRAIALHSAGLTNKPAIRQATPLAASDRGAADLVAMAGTGMDLLAEIRKLLGIEESGNVASALRAILEKVKALLDGKKADAEEADVAADAEVAASVRRELGLPANAAPNAVLVALGGIRGQITAQADLRELDAFLAPFIAAEVIQPASKYATNREDYDRVVALAKADRVLCKDLLDKRVMSLPPQGRTGRNERGEVFSTLPPSAATAQRFSPIGDAKREWESSDTLRGLTDVGAYVAQKLRDAGDLVALSGDEKRQLGVPSKRFSME